MYSLHLKCTVSLLCLRWGQKRHRQKSFAFLLFFSLFCNIPICTRLILSCAAKIELSSLKSWKKTGHFACFWFVWLVFLSCKVCFLLNHFCQLSELTVVIIIPVALFGCTSNFVWLMLTCDSSYILEKYQNCVCSVTMNCGDSLCNGVKVASSNGMPPSDSPGPPFRALTL